MFKTETVNMLCQQDVYKRQALFRKINDFNAEVISGRIEISQDSAKSMVAQLKKDDDTGPIVLIKAHKLANYGNFVDILDEMNTVSYTHLDVYKRQICCSST